MTAPAADVCARCEYPVVLVNGRWVHADTADAALCSLLALAAKP